MIKFDNDYSKSAHPVILDVLTQDAKNSHTGYGLDTWCKRATAEIRRATGSPTADVHYLVGGTQTNMTIIDIALRSFEGVIAADTGHINVHEAGAIEYTGHKVIALPSKDGKITAAQVREEGRLNENNPTPGHVVEPKMVYAKTAVSISLSMAPDLAMLWHLRQTMLISSAWHTTAMFSILAVQSAVH